MLKNNIKIIHIDDEEAARQGMSKIIELFIPNATIVAQASNLDEGIQLIKKVKFDLLLLDLNLPDGNGIFLVEKNMDIAKKVVFTTADDTKGIKALKLGVLDYIVKPYSIQDVEAVVEKVIQQKIAEASLNNLTEKLRVPDQTGIRFIEFEDIIRLESEINYTRIYLKNGSDIFVSKTLKSFESACIGKGFIRIHQSHLVNSKYIKKYINSPKSFVELTNLILLPCSTKGKVIVKKHFGV